jgi:S-adenosylmethionine:tRNA ribosyltransferase-isomerase
MRVSDFDFPFDASLIADHPVEPRDHARLLRVPRAGESCSHYRVADLPKLLNPNDLLVVNDTKVIPVRLRGRKRPGGGRIDMVLIRKLSEDSWEALVKGGGKPGQIVDLAEGAFATVIESGESGTVVKLSCSRSIPDLLHEIGQMPLPPYIKRLPREADRVWYQTVFARAEGSVAAPTAGLHFTPGLLTSLRESGIRMTAVTLHVGPATFRPVKVEDVCDHPMLPEQIEVSPEAAAEVKRARAVGGRIVAVGTTVVRTLETAACADGVVKAIQGESRLFVVPGYRFRVVDAMLTNFHLPRSTLLMLVSAFVGLERLRAVYEGAIEARYRFYSYGDAMLIL